MLKPLTLNARGRFLGIILVGCVDKYVTTRARLLVMKKYLRLLPIVLRGFWHSPALLCRIVRARLILSHMRSTTTQSTGYLSGILKSVSILLRGWKALARTAAHTLLTGRKLDE